MESDRKPESGLQAVDRASDQRDAEAAPEWRRVPPRRSKPYYATRARRGLGILLFVTIAGLPLVAVPALRNKLESRVEALRTALQGRAHRPLTTMVGENREPFPEEYAHPFVPPRPQYSQYQQYEDSRLTLDTGSQTASRRLAIPRLSEEFSQEARELRNEWESNDGQIQPQYGQGKEEREVYELLLQSNQTIADMVKGVNPRMVFKTWDAARRGEDLFWVRLTFVHSSDDTGVEYIWQVRPMLDEVTPLNFSARSIPRQ